MSKLETNENRNDNILNGLARLERKHWLLSYIFVNFSAVWLPILYTFLGVQLKLVTVNAQSCQFTLAGFILMIVILLASLIGNGAIIYDEKTSDKNRELKVLENELLEQKESGVVLRDLNKSANKICESKMLTLMGEINHFIEHPQEVPPAIISNPQKQLDSLGLV